MQENQSKKQKGGRQPGAGRPKGSLDKGNALIRDMLAQALDKLGGVDYLVECGQNEKTRGAFLALVGKMMPLQVTGQDGAPLIPPSITFVRNPSP